jgi:hypothetical protein
MKCPIKNSTEDCPLLQTKCLPCIRRRELSDAKSKNYVFINSLKWDKINLMNGLCEEYFNFEEASIIASNCGKRLPTKNEFNKLIRLGSTWDDEKNGRWFGYDHSLKSESSQSVFFYAGGIGSVPISHGFYWSSTMDNYGIPYNLFFDRINVVFLSDLSPTERFMVKLVSE